MTVILRPAQNKHKPKAMSAVLASIPIWMTGYFILLAVVSPICFVAFGMDKRRAQNGKRRIPEKTLHLLEICGGWPGGLIGQRTFRHKTRKLSYQAIFWGIVFLHVLLFSFTCYAWLSRTND
jgi:uncharacterized membrane protein YsdA (DUF1294 family)